MREREKDGQSGILKQRHPKLKFTFSQVKTCRAERFDLKSLLIASGVCEKNTNVLL